MITDSKIYNGLSLQWSDLSSMFADWKTNIDSLSSLSTDAQIDSALTLAQKNSAAVTRFLDLVSTALVSTTNSSTAQSIATIGTWKQVVSAARNSISGTTIALTTAESTLAGARSSHTSPGQAQISSAEAGVKNLEAQLAKTIIRAPISGKISALPLRPGELATPGQLIATIVGSGGLQVKAYVSGEDLYRIKKDATVTLRGSIKGVVSSVAPSVSQINKKVEIKISITDPDTTGLVVGESIQALIQAEKAASVTAGTYVLPIQNVKIVPGDAYVFVVDADSKIQKVPVILGEVKGDFIEIKSGLTDDMSIVSPVYELNEGESVTVQ
jgi:RND family efflux transporter MFP subunit